jgi:hypothetical protein
MNKRLRDAYCEYLDDLSNAGMIDHALNSAILEGKTVEEHIVEVLRAAGKPPDGCLSGSGREGRSTQSASNL